MNVLTKVRGRVFILLHCQKQFERKYNHFSRTVIIDSQLVKLFLSRIILTWKYLYVFIRLVQLGCHPALAFVS